MNQTQNQYSHSTLRDILFVLMQPRLALCDRLRGRRCDNGTALAFLTKSDTNPLGMHGQVACSLCRLAMFRESADRQAWRDTVFGSGICNERECT